MTWVEKTFLMFSLNLSFSNAYIYIDNMLTPTPRTYQNDAKDGKNILFSTLANANLQSYTKPAALFR